MATKLCPFSVQLDSDGSNPVELSYGSVLVGRGPFLGVKDRNVSRKHAELVVDPKTDELRIISLTENPTFVRKLGSADRVVLRKGEELALCPGESFYFLSHGPGFRVQSTIVDKVSNNEQTLDYKITEKNCDQTLAIDDLEKYANQTLAYDIGKKHSDQTLDINVLEKNSDQTLDINVLEKNSDQTLDINVLEKNSDQTLDINVLEKNIDQTLDINLLEKNSDQTLDINELKQNNDQTLDINELEQSAEQSLDCYKTVEKLKHGEKLIEQTLAYNIDKNHSEHNTPDEMEIGNHMEQTLGYTLTNSDEIATLEIDRSETLMIESPKYEHTSPSTQPITPDHMSPSTDPIISYPKSPSTDPIISYPKSPSTDPIISYPKSPSTEPIISYPKSPSTEPIMPEPKSPSTELIISAPKCPSPEPQTLATASLTTESSIRKKRKLPAWMLDNTSDEDSKSVSKKPNITKASSRPSKTIKTRGTSKPKPKYSSPSPGPCSSTTEHVGDDAPMTTHPVVDDDSDVKPDETSGSETTKKEDSAIPPCPYGARCYRKNPDHLRNFSHPPKLEGAGGAKKECPYGAHCYRKNPDHFKEFSHSKRDSSEHGPRGKKPRAAKAKKRSVLEGTSDDDGEKNAYDLKDDFIDDSGSESSASSSSFESSESEGWQPEDELGLVDEAKAFMKNPKMIKKV